MCYHDEFSHSPSKDVGITRVPKIGAPRHAPAAWIGACLTPYKSVPSTSSEYRIEFDRGYVTVSVGPPLFSSDVYK